MVRPQGKKNVPWVWFRETVRVNWGAYDKAPRETQATWPRLTVEWVHSTVFPHFSKVSHCDLCWPCDTVEVAETTARFGRPPTPVRHMACLWGRGLRDWTWSRSAHNHVFKAAVHTGRLHAAHRYHALALQSARGKLSDSLLCASACTWAVAGCTPLLVLAGTHEKCTSFCVLQCVFVIP